MKNYGRTSVAELLGDALVYRNLRPMDGRLPRLDEIRACVGLAPSALPRKSEADYARVIAYLLRYARLLDSHNAGIERLIFVGDTRLNDGGAFTHICQAGGWPGMAFIASESAQPRHFERIPQPEGVLVLANRWSMLEDFDRECRDRGFAIDVHTAVVLDLDKTTIGARGRNDRVIDEARVAAVRETVEHLLGGEFDREAFELAYGRLNQPEFHPFTADNQDYLAYICLILGAGFDALPSFQEAIRAGQWRDFIGYLEFVHTQREALPPRLRRIHEEVYARVHEGDPTPFKAFRYNEYRQTAARFGCMADDSPAEALLTKEIVITQEVRSVALRWKQQGALLFGLSDKPDEASIPTGSLADQGYLPLHRLETHAVGEG